MGASPFFFFAFLSADRRSMTNVILVAPGLTAKFADTLYEGSTFFRGQSGVLDAGQYGHLSRSLSF